MPPARLEATGLAAGYGDVPVLHGIDIAIAAGSVTAVIGSNGAGKTTLMRCLAGLLAPRAGQLLLDGTDITSLRADRRVALGLSLVPEGRLVFADFTVAETLRIGAYAAHARANAQRRADEMYALFPRLRDRRQARAGTLSGGEQQMLALARGLMSVPRILLLDEPSLGLAPAMAEEVFGLVRRIRASGITIGLVEQNVQAALSLADYVYVVENGRIAQHGRSADLADLATIRESYLGL